MSLSRIVSEIFKVEKYRDLEIPVKGQSRSLKVIPCDRLYMVIVWLVFISNFVPKRWGGIFQKMRFFEIFDFKNAVTLKTGLRSLKMSPFDRAYMTFI